MAGKLLAKAAHGSGCPSLGDVEQNARGRRGVCLVEGCQWSCDSDIPAEKCWRFCRESRYAENAGTTAALSAQGAGKQGRDGGNAFPPRRQKPACHQMCLVLTAAGARLCRGETGAGTLGGLLGAPASPGHHPPGSAPAPQPALAGFSKCSAETQARHPSSPRRWSLAWCQGLGASGRTAGCSGPGAGGSWS